MLHQQLLSQNDQLKKLFGQLYGAVGGDLHKLRELHAVAAVGNDAQNSEGHLVDEGHVADGGTLHLAGDGTELRNDALLGGGLGHEQVTRSDGADRAVELQLGGCLAKRLEQLLVDGNFDDVNAGKQTLRITMVCLTV